MPDIFPDATNNFAKKQPDYRQHRQQQAGEYFRMNSTNDDTRTPFCSTLALEMDFDDLERTFVSNCQFQACAEDTTQKLKLLSQIGPQPGLMLILMWLFLKAVKSHVA